MVRFRQFLFVLMFAAAPLVLADPISVLQTADAPLQQIRSSTLVPHSKAANVKKAVSIAHGIASWYSESDRYIQLRTANGEIFDDTQLTCASWNYSFGTRLKVTNLDNGKSVVCTVNDRGPAKRLGRVIDLTKAAFQRIAHPRLGLVKVSVVPVNG